MGDLLKPNFAFTRLFLNSVAAVLFVTASAKLVSAFGSAKILYLHDPLLSLPYRELFLWAAVLEFAVLGVLLSAVRDKVKLCLIGWAAGMFLLYRMANWILDSRAPCPCLGTLTDSLRIPPGLADAVLLSLLSYMSIGTIICWISISRNQHAFFDLKP